MTKKKEDGGYIAIQGFAYQFDKALLDMLQHPNKGYQIENLQDHNYEDYAIQRSGFISSDQSATKLRWTVSRATPPS